MKILIVDDDSLVRISLKTLVNWEEQGYTLVGEAVDGRHGLQMIEELQPDIVLQDIKMPVMDGIEMLRRIKELPHPPKSIILSSYDDFVLVKQAMQLGAEDYILKMDISVDNLLDILKKITDEIISTRRQDEQQNQMANQVRKNLSAMRKSFFSNLIGGFYSSEQELEKTMQFLGIQLDSKYVYCFIIKLQSDFENSSLRKNNMPVLNYAIINVVEEIVAGMFIGYCFEWGNGEFYVIASVKDKQQHPSSQQINSYSERLEEMLKEYLNITVKVAVGEGGTGIKGVLTAHNNAQQVFFNRESGASVSGLRAAKAYIQEHFVEEISLQHVAEQVGFNPSYLSNLLKKETGKSYSEYIIDLRIQRAKELIKTTECKMYEISEMAGYPNTFYFSRLFKRETGMTPGEYKKSVTSRPAL